MTESINKSYDLSKFRLKCILSNNSKTKSICVLGTFPSQSSNEVKDLKEPAIVFLEKTAFTENDVNTNETNENDVIDSSNSGDSLKSSHRKYFSSQTILKKEFINDIYGNFSCYPMPDINSVKATIICPCTEKHIQKYSSQEIRIVQETPDLYKAITEPRVELETEQFTLDWVYNILNHEKESERIIFEDSCKQFGFILLPDLKWDGKTLETFHAIAIVHQLKLKSLRSLNADHLPLLRNIRNKAIDAIKEKFKLNRSQLRIYIHYQPSFYHLHIHFTYLKYDAPGIFCERSHLLDTVINNIELLPSYYQKATLSFVIKESDPYYKKYLSNADITSISNGPDAKKAKLDE